MSCFFNFAHIIFTNIIVNSVLEENALKLKKSLAGTRSKFKRISSKLEAKKKNLRIIKSNIDDYNVRSMIYSTKINQLESELSCCKQNLRDAKTERDQVIKKCDGLKEDLQNLKQQSDKNQLKIANKEKELAVIRLRLEKEQGSFGSLTAGSELAEALRELADSNRELTASNRQVVASNREVTASNRKVVASNQEVVASNWEVVSSNRDVVSTIRELRSKQEDQQQQIEGK